MAGAASKPPTEEAARLFEKKTGVKVNLVFGGSGTVLSQMKLSKKGDLYFPGSSDFMEQAKHEDLVYPETESRLILLGEKNIKHMYGCPSCGKTYSLLPSFLIPYFIYTFKEKKLSL